VHCQTQLITMTHARVVVVVVISSSYHHHHHHHVHVGTECLQTVTSNAVTSLVGVHCVSTSSSLEVQCLEFLALSTEQSTDHSQSRHTALNYILCAHLLYVISIQCNKWWGSVSCPQFSIFKYFWLTHIVDIITLANRIRSTQYVCLLAG